MGNNKLKKYKAAVIGCGKIGLVTEQDSKRIKPATHAGAFVSHPRTALAAVCDIDEKKLEISRSLFPDALTFNSPEEMFETVAPDIVSIATHLDSHRSLVELAARYGVKAIVCEKPIAPSIEDAHAMINVCERSGSMLFINHLRRFDPLLRRTAQEIRERKIGEISQASCYYTNGLMNSGTHLIDLLRMFFGECKSVRAVKNFKTSHPAGDVNLDGIMEFEDGVRVSFQSLEVKDYAIFDLYFYGSKGALHITRFGFEIEWLAVRNSIDFDGYKELNISQPQKEGDSRSFMAPMAEHVVACLDGKEIPLSRGEDGLKALEALIALKQSAELDGKKIKL
ncbi:MAG: hypothetical protein A2787_09820 [Omnitrophica WOR_2 bacterium RIFCSPHIGHO2_01_FULL_48_9]|nr:MAG: hypothetical protein A2787_09820 [Omnitrophica WOR_2 bacterium RIFCSPHIGHO2_01_FULL_48_9]